MVGTVEQDRPKVHHRIADQHAVRPGFLYPFLDSGNVLFRHTAAYNSIFK